MIRKYKISRDSLLLLNHAPNLQPPPLSPAPSLAQVMQQTHHITGVPQLFSPEEPPISVAVGPTVDATYI